MPVAIKTAYLGATNVRGSRVKATAMDPSRSGLRLVHDKRGPRAVTLEWNPALGSEGNHAAAAKALAERLQWDGEWHMADAGNFYVWVRTNPFTHHFTIAEEA